jgi:hypothetical protein
MTDQEPLATAGDFAISVLLGALIGIEREKRKSEEDDTGHVAGLRTFTLLALLGAVAGWLERETSAPWILAAAILIVGALVIVGYFINAKPGPGDKGLTTEIAAMVVFLLGPMVMLGDQALAIGLGVITAAVLAYKQPLHGFVEKLGWDDVYAGVRLLIATFIALPLLPDRAIDPWGALNPYKLWLLVILISSLSLVGYVLTRWLGPTRGAALTGLTGGLVSSTAVTLSFSKEAREKPQEATALACGILLSWTVMFARVIVVVAIVNRALMTPCAGSVCGDGCHRRRLRVSLFSRRIAQRQACQKEFQSRESVQPDRRSEIRRPVRGGSPRDQVRAGAFSAERPLRGRRACRPDRCRCHHAVDVGVRPKRRRTGGGHRHRDRGAFEYPGEMRHGLRAGWPCARQAACGRDSRDPHRRARRGFLLPALHVVLAGH